ncbi:nestin [Elgaria multicarinata webbii]|uniref:nestin n=1 Tax=Elgaria multicarinata webbii TaxID=159646 RepID=UPI002FCD13D9
MESLLGSRPAGGEEPLQMWQLNQRLEAYLARVQHLEDENELLRAEAQSLSARPAEGSWRGQCEAEVGALRAALARAARDHGAAELARDGLRQQAQQLGARCQRERAARDQAAGLLARGEKQLQDERRAQLWLRQQAGQLQAELEALARAHRDELAGLQRQQRDAPPPPARALARARAPPLELEDYAQRLASLCQGAVDTYQGELAQLEAALRQAGESLRKAGEGNRRSQRQLQQLESELAGLRGRKEALQESLAQQGQQQHGEAQKLQLAMESLEEEKQSLRVQIAQVLEDRQQLMHLKMSLSLEVATYRTLLEAESTRLQMPLTDFKLTSGFRDAKLEASNSKLQAVSLDRGYSGSRDLRPSPTTFLKGNTKSRLLKKEAESYTANLASKSRSPVAREFQKANTVLQSQSPNIFDVALPWKDVPAFLNADAFKVDSSQQNKVIAATKIETVSQSFFQESPPKFSSISPIVPDVSGESDSSTEQKCQKESEGRGGTATKMETEQTEEKGELYEEVEEEEEKQPIDEPPGKTTTHNVPYPTQLVTEALEIAIKEVNGRDIHFESSLLNMTETENGIPSDNSSSMEEENGDTSSPSTGVLEGPTQKVQKDHMGDGQPTDQLDDMNGDHEACVEQPEQEAEVWVHKDQIEDGQPTDQLEDIKGFEDSIEVNGGHEVYAKQQELEAEVWVSLDAAPLETGLPEEGRNREEIPVDHPVIGDIESYKETTSLANNEGDDDKQPSALQSTEQSDDSENVSEFTESVSQLDKAAAAIVKGEKESWEPGTSRCDDDHAGATGGHLEEMDGGIEDLEVMSTEALHLSEDEERKELWSPSRENEEDDLQAEVLESEQLQAERGFTIENLSPISHTTLSAESCQEHLFLQMGQEKLEEQETLLCKTDSALLEEDGKQMVLEPEVFSVEEAISLDENSAREQENTLADEPWAMGSRGAEEEDGGKGREGVSRHEEENIMGNEDTLENGGFPDLETVSSHDDTCEPKIVLQCENVENVLGQEISKGEQTQGTGEPSEGQVLMEQRMDDDDDDGGPPEADGDIPKGEDLLIGTEATVTEGEETMGTLEMEEIAGHISTNILQDEGEPPQCAEDKQFRTDAHQAEEEQVIIAEKEEEPLQSRHTTHLGQSPVHDISKELEALSEALHDTTNEVDVKDYSDISYHQTHSDNSGSEDSLESLDTSPNATCETDGIEKVLESRKHITLEETLPDHTPLHMYDGQMVAVTGNSQPRQESQEAAEVVLLTKDSTVSLEDTQQVFEEDSSSHPPAKENDNEQKGAKAERGCNAEAAPSQDTPSSEEPPTSKDLEETKTEASELTGDHEELHTTLPESSSEEEGSTQYPVQLDVETDKESVETSQQGNGVEKEPSFIEQIQEEEGGTDSAWESEKDNVFPADPFDPSNTEEGVLVGNNGPVEFSDQGHIEAEGSHKVSPLTSVADLGEIILEEEVSPGDERGVAGSEVLASCEDESLPHVHESQQTSDLESCGIEDHTQQEDLSGPDSSSKGFPDPSPEAVVRISVDSMKDSDILEIVEQALEFNQELIKASEQHVEAEMTPTGGDVQHSPEDKSHYASITSPDVGETQILTETPESSSPSAKDPTGSSHLGVETNANGLQQDPSLADFTEEILNGIEHLHPSNMELDVGTPREESIKKVTVTQQFHKEETDDLSMVETVGQSPSQTPSTEEVPKPGEVISEIHEKPFLDQKELESLDANESIFAEIMQTACVKGGKGTELEAIPVSPHFGGEVLCLETSQHLKFQQEAEEELWSSEDN